MPAIRFVSNIPENRAFYQRRTTAMFPSLRRLHFATKARKLCQRPIAFNQKAIPRPVRFGTANSGIAPKKSIQLSGKF